MKHQTAVLLIVIAVIIGLVVGGLLAGFTLVRFGPRQVIWMFVVAAFILGGGAYALNPLFKSRSAAPHRLIEDIQVMMTSNPAHRITVVEATGMEEVAQAINDFADQYQATLNQQTGQIEQAGADLKAERNRLAALVGQLNQGVLVCNAAGRILLYNASAQRLLQQDGVGFVGLGRSVFGLVDRNAINYALNRINQQLAEGVDQPQAQFVVTVPGGQLVKAELAPVLSAPHKVNGFILTVTDVTQQGQNLSRIYRLVSRLVNQADAAAAAILDAVDALSAEPEPAADARRQRYEQIRREGNALQSSLSRANAEYNDHLNIFDWRMEEMLGRDLLLALQEQLPLPAGAITLEMDESPLWVEVDSYALVTATSRIIDRLQLERGIVAITLRLVSNRTAAALELVWRDDSAALPTLQSWPDNTPVSGISLAPVSVSRVVAAHKGRIEWRPDAKAGGIALQIWLPIVETSGRQLQPQVTAAPTDLPQYDFALLAQHETDPELEQQQLAELSYTVFDTETTGLEPSKGDEIISISAVRVVNGRLLRQEVLDRLIDPRHKLSLESIRVTGISPEMLAGQPEIKHVLPEFYEFAKDTVLVAHNAAFDMRFLRLKEAETGVKFTQPVLDTLLLAAVVSPEHKDYSLEALAERLGIEVVARHSSLGDSIVTAEVLLKLMPLLAEQGITTLGQAREVAQKNYLARLKY